MEPKILSLDVSLAGISGDMLLSALLELHSTIFSKENTLILINDFTNFIESELGIETKILIENRYFGDFYGTGLILEKYNSKMEISDIKAIGKRICNEFLINNIYKKITESILEIMIEAEMEVHNKDHIHLHELGTLDTVLDIYLSVIILQKMEIQFFQHSPVALGQGIITTQHGKLHVPAPATLRILEKYNIPTVEGPTGGEATTPTGIAIIVAFSNNFQKSQSAIWKYSALGFGNKKWSDRGNFLRVRIGIPSLTRSKVSVLETNIDDMNGEILGYASQKLLDEGALDVSFYPIFMKKNRPAYCIRVIVKQEDEDRIGNLMQQETGSLGIRITEVNRHIGSRSILNKTAIIEGIELNFKVKSGIYYSKIEFEDLKRISEEFNIPIIKLKKILEQQLK